MGRPVEIHADAAAEAREAWQWYATNSTKAAQVFQQQFERAVERIANRPEFCTPYLHGTRMCLLRKFPYLVVFHMRESTVYIVAVAHAKRRPGYWKTRLG